jgi:hypothetical protein
MPASRGAMKRLSVLFVLLVLSGACSDDGSTQSDGAGGPASPTPSSAAISPGPGCTVLKEKKQPEWVPEDMPLPRGTYFYRELDKRGGFNRGRFVVQIGTVELRRFIFEEWPAAGFVLTRPDHEPGEVESLFRGADGTGLFKANDVLCDPAYTTMLLIFRGP